MQVGGLKRWDARVVDLRRGAPELSRLHFEEGKKP
jgi:hypothetical protein